MTFSELGDSNSSPYASLSDSLAGSSGLESFVFWFSNRGLLVSASSLFSSSSNSRSKASSRFSFSA